MARRLSLLSLVFLALVGAATTGCSMGTQAPQWEPVAQVSSERLPRVSDSAELTGAPARLVLSVKDPAEPVTFFLIPQGWRFSDGHGAANYPPYPAEFVLATVSETTTRTIAVTRDAGKYVLVAKKDGLGDSDFYAVLEEQAVSRPRTGPGIETTTSSECFLIPGLGAATLDDLHEEMLAGRLAHDGALWLKDNGDMSSVPALLKVLEHNKPPPGIKGAVCTYGAAAEALRQITGESDLRDYADWLDWWRRFSTQRPQTKAVLRTTHGADFVSATVETATADSVVMRLALKNGGEAAAAMLGPEQFGRRPYADLALLTSLFPGARRYVVVYDAPQHQWAWAWVSSGQLQYWSRFPALHPSRYANAVEPEALEAVASGSRPLLELMNAR